MINKINHTQISNDFIDISMRELTGGAVKVFISIARKTIGWHKDIDRISLSQLHLLTGMGINNIKRALIELIKKDIIKQNALLNLDKKIIGYEYEINYTMSETDTRPCPKRIHPMSETDTHAISETDNTKDTITKETTQKKIKKEFVAPSLQEVIDYYRDHLYNKELATIAYNYYTAGEWNDRNGTPISNWKLKMQWWFNDKKNEGYKIKPIIEIKKEEIWQPSPNENYKEGIL